MSLQTEAEPDATPVVATAQLSGDRYTSLAQSRLGRRFLTGLIGLLAIALMVPNLPPGPFTDTVDVLWSPATEFGLRQQWTVFAPNVRRHSVETKALIEFEDGSRTIWQIPQYDAAIGSYREYRWRKWEETLAEESSSERWEPTALWLAEQHRDDGEVIKITLIERKQRIYKVGNVAKDGGPIEANWVERTYYTWERDA